MTVGVRLLMKWRLKWLGIICNGRRTTDWTVQRTRATKNSNVKCYSQQIIKKTKQNWILASTYIISRINRKQREKQKKKTERKRKSNSKQMINLFWVTKRDQRAAGWKLFYWKAETSGGQQNLKTSQPAEKPKWNRRLENLFLSVPFTSFNELNWPKARETKIIFLKQKYLRSP